METTKTTWTLDVPHCAIGFKVRHMMVSNVSGVFKEFDAVITTSEDDFLTAEIDFRMNVASVDTGDEKRDAHLRSADFFDGDNFPVATFKATAIKSEGNGNYLLSGDLTMRGVTKNIQLKVEFGGVMKDPWGNDKAGFTIEGKINRKDWGLNWNAALEAGGILVSEEVKILCEVELTKKV